MQPPEVYYDEGKRLRLKFLSVYDEAEFALTVNPLLDLNKYNGKTWRADHLRDLLEYDIKEAMTKAGYTW